jgi:hypothetical protein
MAKTRTDPNCYLALLTAVLILFSICGQADSKDTDDRSKKRDAQFAGETAWQSERKLGKNWEEITGRFIFQRTCLTCHTQGPASYTRTEWMETLETFPDETHSGILPPEFKDLTAMFSYGRMMPDDHARVEALRTFLSRQAEEVIVAVSKTHSQEPVDLFPRVGESAPEFAITDVAGKTHTLEHYASKGETLVLVFSRAHW